MEFERVKDEEKIDESEEERKRKQSKLFNGKELPLLQVMSDSIVRRVECSEADWDQTS